MNQETKALEEPQPAQGILAPEEQSGELQPPPQAEEVDLLREKLAAAAQKYRALLLAGAPEVPEELVKGETAEEVEASFAAARDMVERVRRQLESRAAAERVPAGAPPRTPLDLGALSAKEKIAYALASERG